MDQNSIIRAISKAAGQWTADQEGLERVMQRAHAVNQWFTRQACEQSLNYWQETLQLKALKEFCSTYVCQAEGKRVGVVMAGNIPLVGLHDLLMVLLSGNTAVVKPSSDDEVLMKWVIQCFIEADERMAHRIRLTEQLPHDLDAVIATGNNNSFRYFQRYFNSIPHVLRKNRKSIAVLDGTESGEELNALGEDVFTFFGLGCRNVSLVFLPRSMDVAHLIKALEPFKHFGDHNRFANNYTYHKALFLMNSQDHLDNGFLLFKEERSLNAPLGCLFYTYYESKDEVLHFITEQKESVQCVVGKNPLWADVPIGESQSPKLQDFADKVDSMQFLTEL